MNREGSRARARELISQGRGTSFSGLFVLEKISVSLLCTPESPLVIGSGGTALHTDDHFAITRLGHSPSGIAFARLEGLPTVVYANERRVAYRGRRLLEAASRVARDANTEVLECVRARARARVSQTFREDRKFPVRTALWGP